MKFLKNIFYSFPIQLLINHLKKNQGILLLWFIIIGIVTQNIGKTLGVPHLFLDSEYLDQVNFISFFIVGAMLGFFTMAFHITTFILDGNKFPFLGSIEKPMKVYTYNNSILPIITITVYIYNIYTYQLNKGIGNFNTTIFYIIGLLTGFYFTQIIIIVLFRHKNNFFLNKLFQQINLSLKKKVIVRNVNTKFKLEEKNKKIENIKWYFNSPFSVTYVTNIHHSENSIIFKLFDWYHLEASIIQIFALSLILVMGYFSEFRYFEMPAAASALMLMTILLLILGAISFWLRNWTFTFIILFLISINYFYKSNTFNTTYEAFGIDYETSPALYNIQKVKDLCNKNYFILDSLNNIHILDNWKRKNEGLCSAKPKMIFICTSGGGQRAASWTLNALQTIDSATNCKSSKLTQLITGASGGLIGAAYYRELYLRHVLNKENCMDRKYFTKITKDVLNPIIFNMVVNDFIFRFKTFTDGKYFYAKDRGFAFEKHLNDNIDSVLNKPISYYRMPEANSDIPLLFITPTITNDGRKLFISPQNISYMNNSNPILDIELHQRVKGIEFLRFFKYHDSENLNFTSALRMSATFPYIMPNVTLPSDPEMEIMDAGLADNFGITNAVKYANTFKDWINENTSGVIFIILRDSEKELEIEKIHTQSLIDRAINPIGGIFGSWDFIQDNNNDNYLQFLQQSLKNKIEIVEFKYLPQSYSHSENASSKERASLSWHLTKKEKDSIRNTIYSKANLKSIKQLQKLLL